MEWAFLTTELPRTLVPLLDGFGQDVRVELDAHGRPAGPLAHVLKVFLIDTRAVVREIYTTSYLYPEVILNDIKTLRLEDRHGAAGRPVTARRQKRRPPRRSSPPTGSPPTWSRRNVRVVDGSWHMPQLERDARAEFAQAHIPGAAFFDIDAIADRRSPLPHMLPRAAEFARAAWARWESATATA